MPIDAVYDDASELLLDIRFIIEERSKPGRPDCLISQENRFMNIPFKRFTCSQARYDIVDPFCREFVGMLSQRNYLSVEHLFNIASEAIHERWFHIGISNIEVPLENVLSRVLKKVCGRSPLSPRSDISIRADMRNDSCECRRNSHQEELISSLNSTADKCPVFLPEEPEVEFSKGL